MQPAISIMKTISVALPILCMAHAGAQVHPEKPTYRYEKCHAVVRARMNDCFTASNSCAGTAREDGQRDAWVYVPAGTCEKIAGGNLTPSNK